MGRRNKHLHNPLQKIRAVLGLTQQDFADLLDVAKNELARREISYRGYEDIPDDWHVKLLRVLGVTVSVNKTKKPGDQDYYGEPVGMAGVPFTREYHKAYSQESIPFVKHPAIDVLKAMAVVGELSARRKREDQFADALKFAIRTFCGSTRFKWELTRKVEQLIKGAKEEDRMAADWLCDVLENEKLRKKLPVLPAKLEYMRKVFTKMKKKE